MPKQIQANELAEIVTALLVDPDLIGELCENSSHSSFMLAIGEAVADHCGGIINGVNESDEDMPKTLSVSRNEECAHGIHVGAWSLHDIDGWDLDASEFIGSSKHLEQESMNETRSLIPGLLISQAIKDGVSPEIRLELADCDSGQDKSSDIPATHRLTILLSASYEPNWLMLQNMETDDNVEIAFDISKGKPSMKLGKNDQFLMHISDLPSRGYVLSPDSESCLIRPALDSECPWGDKSSLTITTEFD